MTCRWRVAAAALVIIAAGCSPGDDFEPLPVPQVAPIAPTSTTARPDFSGVVLAPVEGTTSTTAVVLGPGSSALAGTVQGPDGAVAGATVRVERLVGDAVASADVETGPEGAWSITGVLGGRYRVRAWRVPDMAMVEPQILFVAGGQRAELALVVERFGQLVVDTAIAPDPPPVGGRMSLLIRLSSRTVDADGVVRGQPRRGVTANLMPGPGWALEGSSTATTDDSGNVTFTLVCRAPGPQSLAVSFPSESAALPAEGTPAAGTAPPSDTVPPVSAAPPVGTAPAEGTTPLELPDCVMPPPEPSTSSTSSTATTQS